MTPQASLGRSAPWVHRPQGLRGSWSVQRALAETTCLWRLGTGSGQRLRPSPPCICRVEGASQSGLDPPLRSAHTTVPEIRHARQKCATSLRLNFKQRADSRLAAMVA